MIMRRYRRGLFLGAAISAISISSLIFSPAVAHNNCYVTAAGPYSSPSGNSGKGTGYCQSQHQHMQVAVCSQKQSGSEWLFITCSHTDVYNTGSTQEAQTPYECLGSGTFRYRARVQAWNESGALVHDVKDYTGTFSAVC